MVDRFHMATRQNIIMVFVWWTLAGKKFEKDNNRWEEFNNSWLSSTHDNLQEREISFSQRSCVTARSLTINFKIRRELASSIEDLFTLRVMKIWKKKYTDMDWGSQISWTRERNDQTAKTKSPPMTTGVKYKEKKILEERGQGGKEQVFPAERDDLLSI